MFEKLNYPLGIFINIASKETFYKKYQGKFPERIQCYAVELNAEGVVTINDN